MSGSQMNNVVIVWLSCLLFNALVLYPLVMRVYKTGSIVEGLRSDDDEAGAAGAIVFGAVMSPFASAIMILIIVVPCFKYLAIIDKALATVADQ